MFILTGTVGVFVDFHICQDSIKSFNFLGQADKCSNLETEVFPQKSSAPQIEKKQCCSNLSLYSTASFETDNSVSHSVQIAPTPFSLSSMITTAKTSSIEKRWDIPPHPLIRQHNDLVITYQNFLI